MSNFELLHNIFAFWAIWIRSRGKVAQRSPFAHFLEMKYFIRFWVLAVLIIVKKKLRWLQNLNIKSIHVCMSAVYLLRNDHYVISSRAINYMVATELFFAVKLCCIIFWSIFFCCIFFCFVFLKLDLLKSLQASPKSFHIVFVYLHFCFRNKCTSMKLGMGAVLCHKLRHNCYVMIFDSLLFRIWEFVCSGMYWKEIQLHFASWGLNLEPVVVINTRNKNKV